ncbi:hypothetical protein [Cytobacillus sp. FSL R5-0569]|uniref:hypothetical protein n=1 Tax=Cytobacillus TaxID=2675230 RepID=UPI0030F6C43D
MQQSINNTSDSQQKKKYTTFVNFVVITLLIRVFPFFENAFANTYLIWIVLLGLVVITVVEKLDVADKVKNLFVKYNLNLVIVYVIYISLYFILSVYIFN